MIILYFVSFGKISVTRVLNTQYPILTPFSSLLMSGTSTSCWDMEYLLILSLKNSKTFNFLQNVLQLPLLFAFILKTFMNFDEENRSKWKDLKWPSKDNAAVWTGLPELFSPCGLFCFTSLSNFLSLVKGSWGEFFVLAKLATQLTRLS